MKVPFLHDTALADLSPASCKILLFFCDRQRNGVTIGRVDRDAAALGMSRACWRQRTAELVDAGLVAYEVTTQGYRATQTAYRRFSWVPGFSDGRLRRLSGRASKALLCVCRAADNRFHSVRVRLKTLAIRLGRGIRTASLALAELRRFGVLDTYRTGRSSWMVVRRAEGEEQSEALAPCVAHRSRLALRILTSLPTLNLSQICQQVRRTNQEVGDQLRQAALGAKPLCEAQKRVRQRLVALGLTLDAAGSLVSGYAPQEIVVGLERSGGRFGRKLEQLLRLMLNRGWCKA